MRKKRKLCIKERDYRTTNYIKSSVEWFEGHTVSPVVEIEALANDSDGLEEPQSIYLDVYLGTRNNVANIESPMAHKLYIYPSQAFMNRMIRFDELKKMKKVRWSLFQLNSSILYFRRACRLFGKWFLWKKNSTMSETINIYYLEDVLKLLFQEFWKVWSASKVN